MFGFVPLQTDDSGDGDVISTTTTGARTRNAGELAARIKAAGGALVVDINSSDYIVAANNGLRFSLIRQADGSYRVLNSNAYLLAIAGIALIGLLVLRR